MFMVTAKLADNAVGPFRCPWVSRTDRYRQIRTWHTRHVEAALTRECPAGAALGGCESGGRIFGEMALTSVRCGALLSSPVSSEGL